MTEDIGQKQMKVRMESYLFHGFEVFLITSHTDKNTHSLESQSGLKKITLLQRTCLFI